MARITLSSIKKDLQKDYGYSNPQEIERTAETIWERYNENLQMDVCGPYTQALRSCDVSKKPDSIPKPVPDRKEKFAKFMISRKPKDTLVKIASAFDNANYLMLEEHLTPNDALHGALREYSLEGYVIGHTPISYKQASIIFEAVYRGEYGGLNKDGKRYPYAIPTKFEIFLRTRPDGFFPNIKKQTIQECLKESDERMTGANDDYFSE